MDEVINWLDFYNKKKLNQTLSHFSPMALEQSRIVAQQQDRKIAQSAG